MELELILEKLNLIQTHTINLYRDLEPILQHAELLINFRGLLVEALMKMQLL